MLVAAMVMPSTAWADTITPIKPSNGDGSKTSPYQIGTAAELYWFAGLVNGDTNVCDYNADTNLGTQQNKAACAVLTANITVNSGVLKADGSIADDVSSFRSWTPIGNYDNNYTGTFDGKGYTVSGLYFNDTSKENVGLFGYLGSGGKISNVEVLDSYFEFRMFGGGVCGRNDGEISNCNNSSTVVETSGNGFAGGVCGYNVGGKVLNSYNNGIISGSTNTGGVCGKNQSNGEITNCYNSGTVSGKGETNQIAGVCGDNDINCTISGCYNTGTVSGKNSCGVCFDNYGTVKNCYNTGTVDGQNVCGGVCGSNNSGTITSCYNRGVVNRTVGYVGGICGKIGSSSSTTNCYYDSNIYSGNAIGYIPGGTVDNVMGKTTAQFNSGEVAWLLNGSTSADNSLAWYQNIDNGTADSYPLLDSNGHGKVYQCTPCTGVYSNTENKAGEHLFGENDNGFCHNCGAYQPATLTTDKYDIDGDDTKDKVYEIGNAGQLYWFAGLVNGDTNVCDYSADTNPTGTQQNKAAWAVLTANITVNSGVLKADGSIADDVSGFRSWTPIGNYDNNYTGTFDGQKYTVSGLYFNDSSINYVGLFGYSCGTIQNVGVVGYSCFGTIKNVGVVDSYFNGADFIGGVCGKDDNGTIMNCYNTGTISGNNYVGGVCGENHAEIEGQGATATISNCYNTGAINGSWYVGGVCGQNNATLNGEFGIITATITNCFNTGPVNERGANGGGVCGYNEAINKATSSEGPTEVTATIENCIYCSDTCKGWGVNSANGGSAVSVNVDEKTASQFASGEVAWLLNGSKSESTEESQLVWYQDLSAEGGDIHPVLTKTNSNTVYKVELYCGGGNVYAGMTYANNTEAVTKEHNMPETASFNSEKKIYENLCQTEGCGKTVYYANAAGTIEATPEGTGFTVANYPLQDATAYDNQAVFTATNFIYNRTFSTTEWTTWYVPFDLTLTEEICAQYDFSRINNVHQYDDNGDGNADRTVVESFRQNAGVILKANYPYLVRAKSDADFSMSLPLTNVVPALAETNSIDCQSVDYKYTFTGTYATMGDSGSDKYTLSTDGTWMHFLSLKPMRHYLTITSRNATSNQAAPMLVLLSVIGEEDTTGIVKLYDEERKATETYDLSGRRLPAGSKQRGLIIENGKVTFKK
ncbi:hypothetical protein CIK98_03505 [Prevotella sp. P2-180]|nr:hypothetical protein CIK98_03505 [Prevotella sp. P2-180]